MSSLGTVGLGEGGREVSEEKTPRMSIPRATNQRTMAIASTVTSMREGRTWGGGKEARRKGLRGFLTMPLLRKEASVVGRDGGESGGNK